MCRGQLKCFPGYQTKKQKHKPPPPQESMSAHCDSTTACLVHVRCKVTKHTDLVSIGGPFICHDGGSTTDDLTMSWPGPRMTTINVSPRATQLEKKGAYGGACIFEAL